MHSRLPPLESVRVFEAVVRCGSTVAAAAELGLTHGAVSRRVRALEDHLGASLFDRIRGGRLTPTPAGRLFAEAARRALGTIAEAAASVDAGDRRRVVRVTTTASLAALWLMPRLPRFTARHPAYEVWLSETQALVEPGVETGIDLALRTGSGGWPGSRAEPLMDDALVPVCAPAHAPRLQAPADVAKLRLLHDVDATSAWWRWTEAVDLGCPAWAQQGPRLAGVGLLIQAAASGEGVALVPSRLSQAAVQRGELVIPFSDRVELGAYHWLVRPARPHATPAVRAFSAWLRSEAKA